ncbi:hypothetical protein CASFOL_021460 [Castilleja foliolosa]|uniref:RING-type domain-containing protein n=1 Tax=Castilleja foliolosa TaxID=1961234 RepID=A0ABD3D039_9LAMI
MDIDHPVEVPDTPDRLTRHGINGKSRVEYENHSPSTPRYSRHPNILKDGSRDQPVFIDSGSKGRAPHPTKYFGSSNNISTSSSSRNVRIFRKGVTENNPKYSSHDSIHNGFVDLTERNNDAAEFRKRSGLANVTSSLLGQSNFRTAREELENLSGVGVSNGFREGLGFVGNNIQEKPAHNGFTSLDPIPSPRVHKQKKLVRNGCISPNNIAKGKQVAGKDNYGSVAVAHNNASNASRAPPISVDIRELVAEDRDSHKRKGKGVITHPCSSIKPDFNNKNLQSRCPPSTSGNERKIYHMLQSVTERGTYIFSLIYGDVFGSGALQYRVTLLGGGGVALDHIEGSINFNEKAIGPSDYIKDDGKIIEEESGGWISTRNRNREINLSSPDEELYVISGRSPLRYSSQHHENRLGRSEKGVSVANGDGKGSNSISSEHAYPQPPKEFSHHRNRLGRLNGTRPTASTLIKRQKQGSTSSTRGQCSTPVSDEPEVVSVFSPAEATNSRSTSRNVDRLEQIIEIGEFSPQLRRDAHDEEVRARQVEADERLARELQEQLYNDVPVFGVTEVDENIALAMQHHDDDSDHGLTRTRQPINNERVSTANSRRQSQSRPSSSAPRRGSQARSATSSRMARPRSRFHGQARSLLSSTETASMFSDHMDADMLHILGALEEFNDMGFGAGFVQGPDNFNENDYEMLLALDDNNDRHSGASVRQINGLPQSTVQSENFDETCAVCLDTPTIGDTIRHLPCLHKFHKDCIDPWLRRRTTCPVCKSSVT